MAVGPSREPTSTAPGSSVGRHEQGCEGTSERDVPAPWWCIGHDASSPCPHVHVTPTEAALEDAHKAVWADTIRLSCSNNQPAARRARRPRIQRIADELITPP